MTGKIEKTITDIENMNIDIKDKIERLFAYVIQNGRYSGMNRIKAQRLSIDLIYKWIDKDLK